MTKRKQEGEAQPEHIPAPPPTTEPPTIPVASSTRERERLLYKFALAGLPFGAEFFESFPDPQEVATLAFSLVIRRLAVVVSSPDHADVKDVLAAARVLAQINGKEDPTEPPPERFDARPITLPTGSLASAQQSIERIRALGVESPSNGS